MNLLVTNDDGIDSVFFRELVTALLAAGHELQVVAPAREQSWTGASKTRTRPVKSERTDRGFGCPTWTVDGTPSDCVNIALAHLLPRGEGVSPVHGVVSGLNVGFNCTLGFILASGTVAGAWEGALHGLPSLAVSQNVSEDVYNQLKEPGGRPDDGLASTLKVSAAHAARLATTLLPRTPPRSFTVHNVNFPFPCAPDTPVKRTVPAQFFVPGLFSAADGDGTHRLVWTAGEDASPVEPLTDLACVTSGCISHTVLDYRTLGHG
jgi:5'-nucleotidase